MGGRFFVNSIHEIHTSSARRLAEGAGHTLHSAWAPIGCEHYSERARRLATEAEQRGLLARIKGKLS